MTTTPTNLEGIYAASLTPLKEDLSCDYDLFAKHCLGLIARGCSGVVLFGTTGEAPSFTIKERQKAIKEIAARGVDPRKILVNISCTAVEDAVDLANTALEYGCAAVLLVPPYYFKNVSEEGVIAYYRAVIKKVDNADLRLFLYHIPQFSGVPITMKVVDALVAEFPSQIIGLKESEGNLSLTRAVIEKYPHLAVFVGNEMQLPEAVRLGAKGGISGIANVYPELIVSLYRHGKDASEPHHKAEIESLFAALKGLETIPALKKMLYDSEGQSWNLVRPPLKAI